MGLDRLKIAKGGAALLGAALFAASAVGCEDDDRPQRLLYGAVAAEFRPVKGSVISRVRVLDARVLGRRFAICAEAGLGRFPADTVVVERIGVFSESLTFADPAQKTLYACDGGTDPAGERQQPWCGGSAGILRNGRLLDPRLDVLCRTKEGERLAYAWVEPAAGVRWVGVDQGSWSEMYEAAAGLPVRVATRRNIHGSQARFEITQYDTHGRELVKGTLEAAVAG
jgi:hypothetical protein